MDDQLLITYNFATSELDGCAAVDLVLCDFWKTFDVVNYSALLDELRSIDISGTLLT